MSHPLLLSHLPFTTSSSSSSFTLPFTTTPEHALHDLLQEHPVHHAHLHALPVDKQRHQESLWRENLQSGGNPRTTTPTVYTPLTALTECWFHTIGISHLIHTFVSEQNLQNHSLRPSMVTASAKILSAHTCRGSQPFLFCVRHPSPLERSSAPIDWRKFDETAAVNTTHNKTTKEDPLQRFPNRNTFDKKVDVPVEQVELIPQAQVVPKTVAIPQTQFVDSAVKVFLGKYSNRCRPTRRSGGLLGRNRCAETVPIIQKTGVVGRLRRSST